MMVGVALKTLGLSVGLVAAVVQAGEPLDQSSIRGDIGRFGADAVVKRLYDSHDYEDVLIKRIGEGSVPWIMLASALAPGTDAATAEELGEALIYALPKSPAAVLSVIDLSASSSPRAPSRVCSASFYEGDPTDPRRYRTMAIRAVGGVPDPHLAAARRACLVELRKG